MKGLRKPIKQEPCSTAQVSRVRLLLTLLSTLLLVALPPSCRSKQKTMEHYQEESHEQVSKKTRLELALDERAWEEVSLEELSLCLDSLSPHKIKFVKRRLRRGRQKGQRLLLDSLTTIHKQKFLRHFQHKKMQSRGFSLGYYILVISLSIALGIYLSKFVKHLSTKTRIK